MSSTLRGSTRSKDDYYITPVDEIQKFIKEFKKHELMYEATFVVDPCAGGDDNHPMSYPVAFRNENLKVDLTIDKRLDSKAYIKTDYLKYDLLKHYEKPSMIITNPPFSLALPIVQKALTEVEDNGFVIILQRLNFLGSQARFDFWKGNMPKYIFVHHKRMSFTGDGKTDSIEYCHFCFQKGYKEKFSKLVVI